MVDKRETLVIEKLPLTAELTPTDNLVHVQKRPPRRERSVPYPWRRQKTDDPGGHVYTLRTDAVDQGLGISQDEVGNHHCRHYGQRDSHQGNEIGKGMLHQGTHADDRGQNPGAEHEGHGQGHKGDILNVVWRYATDERFPATGDGRNRLKPMRVE